MRNMTKSLLAVSLFMSSAVGAMAEDLTIVSFGGTYQEVQDQAYFKPFAAETGIKIVQGVYTGEISRIRAMVQSGSTTWDVVDVDSATALQACDDGIVEPIDYSKLGGRESFAEGWAFDCAVPTAIYSTIFAYDANKIKDGPRTVAEFFDVKKFPGKRGLRKDPITTLEFALMADNVPTDKVYEVLATPEGVERALKKLDTIKQDIVWWDAGAQPAQLLGSGEVAYTTAWHSRIVSANQTSGSNFKIVWDHQVLDCDFWVVPKGTTKLDAAYKFLQFASSPEAQAKSSELTPNGPGSVAALKLIDEATQRNLPTSPQNMTSALPIDTQFWADNGDQLRKRFNIWLAQ